MAAASKEPAEGKEVQAAQKGLETANPFERFREQERQLYKAVDNSFRKIAIPAALVCIFFILDGFFNHNPQNATITGFLNGGPGLVMETTEGTIYRSYEEDGFYPSPGKEIIIIKSLLLEIIVSYGNEEVQYAPSQTFHEYLVIAWIMLGLSLVLGFSPDRDIRMAAGALILIGLFILVLTYAVLRP